MDDNSPHRGRRRGSRNRAPWLRLLLIGLAVGTVLGWAIDDMSLGTAYGLMAALTIGALWHYLRPSLRRLLGYADERTPPLASSSTQARRRPRKSR